MELKRKPFQGVVNIIRFNWHFYFISISCVALVFLLKHNIPAQIQLFALWIAALSIFIILISLLVSLYIYDLSNLYQLNWLPNSNYKQVLTIHAGFDETSNIILSKFPYTELTICDFYNPIKNTEISIKRARRAYPPAKQTITVQTDKLPFPDNSFDYIYVILSAHEIRNENERNIFFQELNRVTNPTGQILVTEHLRNWNNFMAYSIGAFHFYPKSSWVKVFRFANLNLSYKVNITPFITTFTLTKNGTTP